MSLGASAETPPDPIELELWSAFKKQGSAAAREKLFSLYYPFARQIARRHHLDRARGDIEFAELSQAASAGLLQALDQFDPDHGVPFRGYASRRIRGSVVDAIGKLSEYREQVSYRNRVRADRARSLAPTDAGNLNASASLDALADLAVGLAVGFMLEDSSLAVREDQADRQPSAYEGMVWRETVAQMAVELERLPDREKLILRLHYLEDVGFIQIAAILQLTKGRVSQLHKGAIELLRRRMKVSPSFRLER